MNNKIEFDGITPGEQLKMALLREGKTQRFLAEKTQIPESYISHYVRGRMVLSNMEKAKITAVLGQEVFE